MKTVRGNGVETMQAGKYGFDAAGKNAPVRYRGLSDLDANTIRHIEGRGVDRGPAKSKNQLDDSTTPLLLEDLRNHPPEHLAELRLLLTSGAVLRPDPRRRGFFEVQGHSHVFYILKYPSGARVLLIAVWERDQASRAARRENTGQMETGERACV